MKPLSVEGMGVVGEHVIRQSATVVLERASPT